MLTPTYLEQLPEPMIELVSRLQNEIIADITKRIVKGKYDTPSAQWMLYKANQLRLSSADVNKIIAKDAKLRERTVREMYSDSVKLALHDDAEIYRYAISENKLPAENGDKITSYFKDVAHNDFFSRGLKNTQGLMRNLTNSMAATANRTLSDALDLAWLEVSSGAFTVDEACFKAVTALTEKGLAVVEYKSGHKDQVDVAVRRAVRTGINKTCCDMQLDFAAEMGSDLVEVSSHLGARPTHADWQGQIYSISGKHPKYKPFSVTGYGTGDGLGGWNCRHSFFPYFEGISLAANMPDFTTKENREMYDNQQQQRAYERAVRKSKRELAGIDAARQSATDPVLKDKLDKEFERKSVTLKNREERLKNWCSEKGLAMDSSRVRTAGFGRSVSQKAVWAAKKKLQVPNNALNPLDNSGGSGIMKEKFNSISDPMFEVTGSAFVSHPQEIKKIIATLKEWGVEISYTDSLGYGSASVGNPGGISVTENASYSAWLHEFQHVKDAKENGWDATRVLFEDYQERIRREKRAYQVEIDLAYQYNRPDIAKRLEENLNAEIRKINEFFGVVH